MVGTILCAKMAAIALAVDMSTGTLSYRLNKLWDEQQDKKAILRKIEEERKSSRGG
jgi:hypothetical protein